MQRKHYAFITVMGSNIIQEWPLLQPVLGKERRSCCRSTLCSLAAATPLLTACQYFQRKIFFLHSSFPKQGIDLIWGHAVYEKIWYYSPLVPVPQLNSLQGRRPQFCLSGLLGKPCKE